MVSDAGEASLGKRRGVVGEVRGTEASQDVEGKIETTDVDARGKSQGAGGNAEVGDDPESFGREHRSGARDEGFEVGLGEAVEEKVGNEQIVGAVEWNGKRTGPEGLEAVAVGCAAFAKESQHGGADVDGGDMDRCVCGEESGGEASVSIAKDEGSFLVEDRGEVAEAAVYQGFTEGEVFEPAIWAGDVVEINRLGHG